MRCHAMTRTVPRAILLENHMKKKVSSEGSIRQVIGPEKRVGPC